MFYALVHYPDIDIEPIKRFKRKYDPLADLIDPHMTLVFLVPESIGEQNLVSHIEQVLSRWQPFPIHLHGLEKSWDHWLFLVLQEGRGEVIKLHEELYAGVLEPYRRPDIQFVPHIVLGLFVKQDEQYDIRNPQQTSFDAERYEAALAEAEQLGLDYRCVVDRLHLVKINSDITQVVGSKEFAL